MLNYISSIKTNLNIHNKTLSFKNKSMFLENYNTFFFIFKKFYWGIVDLQCCVSFRCTAK